MNSIKEENLMKPDFNIYNYMSLYILEYLGNKSPEDKQVNFIEALLSTTLIRKPVSFDERLTAREQTCLFLSALGKTSKETAKILNIALSTVITFGRSILKKLEAINMTHAVFLGIRYDELPKQMVCDS